MVKFIKKYLVLKNIHRLVAEEFLTMKKINNCQS